MNKLPDEISITWHIMNVLGLDHSLTKKQARQVLQAVKRHHDASLGVNWDTLQVWIDIIKEGR